MSSTRAQASYRRSIRYPLIAAFVLAVLIPGVIGTAYTTILMLRSGEQRAAEQLNAVSAFKASQINLWLDDSLRDLTAVVDNTEMLGFVERVMPDTPFPLLSFDAARRLQATFAEMIDQSGRFKTLFVLDMSGNVRVSTDLSLQALETLLKPGMPPVRLLTEGAASIDSPVIMPLRYLPRSQRRELILLQPVLDRDGTPFALLGGYADLTRLDAMMTERTGLGANGETYLLDKDHYLVTPSLQPEGYKIGQTVIEAMPSPPPEASVPIMYYTNYRDTNVIGMTQPLERLGVMLATELDEGEALGVSSQNLVANIGVAVVTVLIAVSVAIWFVNQRIIQPLDTLAGAAAAITAGNLDVHVPVSRDDEFGVLARSFNVMTSHLRSMIDEERHAKQHLEAVVAQYVAFVQQVAQGDLTARLSLDSQQAAEGSSSEDLHILGSNLNDMVEGLGRLAAQIRHAVETIIATTSEIQAATIQQNASILEQDAVVTQTVATVEEVRTTVQQTAARAQAVANTSQESVMVSRSGQEAVADNAIGMQTIREQVDSIARTILMLSERTQQIGEIIETVNGLADQSKLLALNASIEAARAGEEGRGFAVVAMEVRQLADQSRAATARVRDILSEIQQAANAAVMVTEEGSKGSDQGMLLVERSGEAIRELAAAIEEAAQAATQIAASTHQQTNGMDQLATAIAQIKKASEESAAGTRQTEISIQNLVEMAAQLEKMAAPYQLA